MQDKKSLRQHYRTYRQQLSSTEQSQHARQICDQLITLPIFQQAKHIAAYIVDDGEVDPAPILTACWAKNKSIYLPVLQDKQLQFAPYHADTTLQENRYGIPEPTAIESLIETDTLDIVLLPLVAFDKQCNRLGRGAGFYDRTFATLPHNTVLVGLAHAGQQAELLPNEKHDRALNYIVTENAVIVKAD